MEDDETAAGFSLFQVVCPRSAHIAQQRQYFHPHSAFPNRVFVHNFLSGSSSLDFEADSTRFRQRLAQLATFLVASSAQRIRQLPLCLPFWFVQIVWNQYLLSMVGAGGFEPPTT